MKTKNYPFASSVNVAERAQALKSFTFTQCLDALLYGDCVQASTQDALIKRMRRLSKAETPLNELLDALSKAFKIAKEVGADCFQIVPQDNNDNPLGLGLICLDPFKAGAVVGLLKTLSDAEENMEAADAEG